MALGSTLTLKDDSDSSHSFNQIDQLPGQPGTLRVDIGETAPSRRELLIRSQAVGSGSQKADRHNATMTLYEPDANGVLQRDSVSLSIVKSRSSAVSFADIVDALHMLVDMYISTSSFDIDQTTLAALLRGES